MPGYLTGRPPRSKGRRFPPDPPRTEEIVAVMRCCGDGVHGHRARGLIAVLWRAGLRIQEALDLGELDLEPRRGSVLVRSGKGGRRREVGTASEVYRTPQHPLTAALIAGEGVGRPRTGRAGWRSPEAGGSCP